MNTSTIEAMDIIEKMQVSLARDNALKNEFCIAQSLSSELGGLARYNPDSIKFMGIAYTPTQIRNHWAARIAVPDGFDFTIPNITEFLEQQSSECWNKIKVLKHSLKHSKGVIL